MVLVRSFEALLHAGVVPQHLGVLVELGRKVVVELLRRRENVVGARLIVRMFELYRRYDRVERAQDTLHRTKCRQRRAATAQWTYGERVANVPFDVWYLIELFSKRTIGDGGV